MINPTKVIVYVAPQGTWLPFVDEDGVHDALVSKPMRLVEERDYAKLAQGYATLRAERDALRNQAEAAEAERDVLAEKWGDMVDDHGDPLDASGILEYVCTLREELSHMKAERDKLRTACEALPKAMDRAMKYIAWEVSVCNGLKCREGHCASCCGDEAAEAWVAEARASYADLEHAAAALDAALAVQPTTSTGETQ